MLDLLSIKRYFALIIGGNEDSAKKSHLALLYMIINYLELYTCKLLFVSNLCNDILIAKADGYSS